MDLFLKKIVKEVEEEEDVGAHGWTTTVKVNRNFYGYAYKNDNWVLEPIYSSAKEFSDGVAVLTLHNDIDSDRYNTPEAVIDKKGKILFKTYYRNVGNKSEYFDKIYLSFVNGLAVAYKERVGFILIDKKANQVNSSYFYSSESAKINDMPTLLKQIKNNGAKILFWANENLFLQKENLKEMYEKINDFVLLVS